MAMDHPLNMNSKDLEKQLMLFRNKGFKESKARQTKPNEGGLYTLSWPVWEGDAGYKQTEKVFLGLRIQGEGICRITWNNTNT